MFLFFSPTISFFKICLFSTYFHSHGHLSTIYGIDALSRERAISVSDDNSARVWKIEEEKQLVYTYDFSFIELFFQHSLSSLFFLFFLCCFVINVILIIICIILLITFKITDTVIKELLLILFR